MPKSRHVIRSTLAKVDAHTIQQPEYDEAPELTDDQLASGRLEHDGVAIRRGRPKAAVTKEPIKLRLDREVLSHFRRTGKGWQSRINDILLRVARRRRKSASPARKRKSA